MCVLLKGGFEEVVTREPKVKRCSRCGKTKPIDDFYLNSRRPGGRTCYCKICNTEKHREWVKKNPRRYRELARRSTWKRLFKDTGITEEIFAKMVEQQGGACLICGRIPCPDAKGVTLTLDHDHKTGAVRGLLCVKCNAALGQFEDNAERCLAAARYLESMSKKH